MGFLRLLGRAVAAIATGGVSEIQRVAAHAAGAPKELIRGAETVFGAAAISGAQGAVAGLITGGQAGALVGGLTSAALAGAQGTAEFIESERQRVRQTPFIAVSLPGPTIEMHQPTESRGSTFGTLGPAAFASFTPFNPSGGNPSWRSLELRGGSLARRSPLWADFLAAP